MRILGYHAEVQQVVLLCWDPSPSFLLFLKEPAITWWTVLLGGTQQEERVFQPTASLTSQQSASPANSHTCHLEQVLLWLCPDVWRSSWSAAWEVLSQTQPGRAWYPDSQECQDALRCSKLLPVQLICMHQQMTNSQTEKIGHFPNH